MGALTFGFIAITVLALWAVRRSEQMLPVWCALALNLAVSNLVYWLQQDAGTIEFDARVSFLIVVEVLLSSMAFMARMTGATRLTILIVVAATVSTFAHTAILFETNRTLADKHVWNLVTNLCYVAECLLVTSAGLLERARQDHRDRRPSRSRVFVARNVFGASN